MTIDFHPPASGLPLASAVLLCVAEAARFIPLLRAASGTLRATAVTACIVAVLAAFISGYGASSSALNLSPTAEQALAFHHSLGKALLVTSLLLGTFYYLMRIATHGKKLFIFFYYLVVVLQVVGTIWVGALGGGLVFDYGINVVRR